MGLRSIEAIVKAFQDAGVRYLIVGGLAVNAPRIRPSHA
jgi:phosphoribosylformimino-5-aminoimidazole carboxamide ribonucleotide (ProFAR) isomerase